MSEREVPKILYRYYSPKAIEYALEARTLRFSSPLEFNDVFDCHYLSDSRYAAIQKFRFRQSLGIVCLTETATNHLMWVHYAQRHGGFVLGFNMAHPFFQNNPPKPVSYKPAPPTLEECDDPALTITTGKSLEWKYEEEWRVVRDFQRKSESRDVEFPPDALCEVALGARMEQRDLARVVRDVTELRSSNPDLELYEARPNPKSWAIDLEPSFRLPCPVCDGSGVQCNVCGGSGVTRDPREMQLQSPARFQSIGG